jgi:hypothetical protein
MEVVNKDLLRGYSFAFILFLFVQLKFTVVSDFPVVKSESTKWQR